MMLHTQSLSLSGEYDNFQDEAHRQMHTRLSLCHEGDKVQILKILGSGGFKKRLVELGLRRGKELKVVRYAPLKDPMEVCIDSCHVSLRVEEADKIDVKLISTKADD